MHLHMLLALLVAMVAHCSQHAARSARPRDPMRSLLILPPRTVNVNERLHESNVGISLSLVPTPTPSEGARRGVNMTSSCQPSSICMDGLTCGVRFGGCYDQNHCDGNTSPFPIPTCVDDPSKGLTNQRLRQVEEPRDEVAGSC